MAELEFEHITSPPGSSSFHYMFPPSSPATDAKTIPYPTPTPTHRSKLLDLHPNSIYPENKPPLDSFNFLLWGSLTLILEKLTHLTGPPSSVLKNIQLGNNYIPNSTAFCRAVHQAHFHKIFCFIFIFLFYSPSSSAIQI